MDVMVRNMDVNVRNMDVNVRNMDVNVKYKCINIVEPITGLAQTSGATILSATMFFNLLINE